MGARFASALPFVAAAAIAAPIGFVLASLAQRPDATLAHIWSTTGPDYLAGTLFLCAAVGLGAGLVGAATAALAALTEFPGRRTLSVALALPLAMPAYIAAYAWGDLFAPFGALAEMLGAANLPEIRSAPGAALVLTFAVCPYVYLATRASLESRSAAYFEAARTLGATPASALRRVLLPAGRAAFAGGLALALMETIADYGVADYFGVPTLSVGILRAWHGLGDLVAASQLASGLFLIALLVVVLEESARRGMGAESARARRAPMRFTLSGIARYAAPAFCAIPVLFGFAIPTLVLTAKLAGLLAPDFAALGEAAANTGIAAMLGGGLTMAIALMLALAMRRRSRRAAKAAVRVATLGYALPGAVIAIGVLGAVSALRSGLGVAPAALAGLVYAYAARFLTAAWNAVEGGMAQIHPLTDDAARMLGAPAQRIAARIYWPLARPAILAGAIVVLIDIARELPATLILRPFDFETLATRVYRLASDERLAEAAPAALLLIAISLVPALLLDRFGRGPTRSR